MQPAQVRLNTARAGQNINFKYNLMRIIAEGGTGHDRLPLRPRYRTILRVVSCTVKRRLHHADDHHSFKAVLRFPHHLKVVFKFQYSFKFPTHSAVVVCWQDSDLLHNCGASQTVLFH